MSVTMIVFYFIAFLSTYVQVFFFVTFLENRKHIVFRTKKISLDTYPKVTIIVPCWNEERTIAKTVTSILGLEYPKDKLDIILVDDGSTDNTYSIMEQYKTHPSIRVIKKENGGKHTAMNMGIEMSDSPFVGCLDADSFVHPEALKRIMTYFQAHPDTQSVAPSIIIDNPKTFIQRLQKIEYTWAIFIKKMLGLVNGIHVTPGPFSIYRREIFGKIGLFRKAHNTEDMEIAFRMQVNHLRIRQCNDAYVYTVGPATIKALYKQRLRWLYGFIQNTIDYRKYLLRPEFGVFSLFTVPSGFVSAIAAPFMLIFSLYRLGDFITGKVVEASVTGITLPTLSFSGDLSWPAFNFDWFYVPASPHIFIAIVLYLFLAIGIFIGRSMEQDEERKESWPIARIVPFVLVYSVIAPLWILRALFNTVTRRKTSWR